MTEQLSALKSFRGFSTDSFEEADVIIKGIPFDGGASLGMGACEGPSRMRELSVSLPPITENGTIIKNLLVKDEGDFDVDMHIERYFDKIRKGTKEIFEAGKFGMFMGGDHSVTIPLQNSFFDVFGKDKKVGVIHIDSHPDIINNYSSSNLSHACTNRRSIEHEYFDKNGLTLVGIRCFEEEEVDFLEKNPEITVKTAYDCFEKGIKTVCDEIKIKYRGYDSIYVTLDIDALDPAYAPGTGTPEAGGFTTRDVLNMIRFFIKELPVKAMDIVEVSPPLDVPTNITSYAALKIMYEALGQLSKKKNDNIEF